MSNQQKPLHDICDTIWKIQNELRFVKEKLEENKPVRAYNITIQLDKELGSILSKLREKALREEGEHHVVNETYKGTEQ